MNNKNYTYKVSKNDECYTPAYAVKPIIKYIKKDWVVWCPFDTEESEFVKQISKTNKVIFSHIQNGEDFLTYDQEKHFDVIVSNPPFSNKKEHFLKAMSYKKPFCLLMTVAWLNDATPKKIFKNNNLDLQLLMFDKRIKYLDENRNVIKGSPNFSSAYFCSDFLDRDLVIDFLEAA